MLLQSWWLRPLRTSYSQCRIVGFDTTSLAWVLKFPERIAYMHTGRSLLLTVPSFIVFHTESRVRMHGVRTHRDAPQHFHLLPSLSYLSRTPSLWKGEIEWNRVFWVLHYYPFRGRIKPEHPSESNGEQLAPPRALCKYMGVAPKQQQTTKLGSSLTLCHFNSKAPSCLFFFFLLSLA